MEKRSALKWFREFSFIVFVRQVGTMYHRHVLYSKSRVDMNLQMSTLHRRLSVALFSFFFPSEGSSSLSLLFFPSLERFLSKDTGSNVTLVGGFFLYKPEPCLEQPDLDRIYLHYFPCPPSSFQPAFCFST